MNMNIKREESISFLLPLPPFHVLFTFASSPLSESLEQVIASQRINFCENSMEQYETTAFITNVGVFTEIFLNS